MSRQTPGNYVPLDVNYPRDAAIRRAGEHAELLFVRGIAYAKGARSGGFVPDFDIDVVAVGLRNVPARIAALVRENLWIAVEGGWMIRSWGPWNETDDYAARRRSAGGSRGNHERWHTARSVTDPDCQWCTESPNPSPPDIATRSLPDSPTDIAPELATESQGKGREGKGITTSSDKSDTPDLFARFWDAYPRKDAKVDARKAWSQVTKTVEPQTIIDGLAAYPFSPERRFQALPASWLRGHRWADEATTTPAAIGRRLTTAELDDLLGQDVWTCPEAPRDLDDEAAFQWRRERILEHAEQRQAAARTRTAS